MIQPEFKEIVPRIVLTTEKRLADLKDQVKKNPIRPTIEYEWNRDQPVTVHINHGIMESIPDASRQSLPYAAIEAGDLMLIPGMINTIDVLPVNPDVKCPFVVTVNDAQSRPQASPVAITPQPRDTISIRVLEPIHTDKADAYDDEGGRLTNLFYLNPHAEVAEMPTWSITRNTSDQKPLPFFVDIYRQMPGTFERKLVHSVKSHDGNSVPLTMDQSQLEPGIYFVSVQPSLRHYPLAARLGLSYNNPDDNLASERMQSVRRSNLYRTGTGAAERTDVNLVPVELRSGEHLNVVVEEETESYNQRMFTIGDKNDSVAANVIFNTPYLSMNIGPHDKFSPSENERFPNALFAYRALGAKGLARSLAEKIVRQIDDFKTQQKNYEENRVDKTERPKPPTQVRWNHVTFMFAMQPNGDLPKAILALDVHTLTPILQESIEIIMDKPHRNSDSLEIFENLDIPPPESKLIHLSKRQCVENYFNTYERRWNTKMIQSTIVPRIMVPHP